MLCFNSFIILCASPIACMYVQSNREYKFSLIEGEILLSMVMVKKTTKLQFSQSVVD